MTFHAVLGAGTTANATALLLADSGERVRQISRRGAGVEHSLVERVAADASDPDLLTELTDGAITMVNCAAPPYDRWPGEFPPLADALLVAAGRTGAGYVMLGNHYGYGAVEGPITEDLPMAPTTVKGGVRARMWTDALASGVRVTEVRASDFVGAGAMSLFGLLVVPAVLSGEPARYPGDLDAPHSWSFVGDVARTLVAAGRDERSWGRAWHVPSTATISTRELAVRLAEVTGAPTPDLEALSAAELAVAGKSDPVTAEVVEMLYMLERPFVVDSSAAERALDLKPTPLDEVLASYGG